MAELTANDVSWLREIPGRVRARKMYGLDHVVRALLAALLSGGHVLLEGNPGLGKTALVKALADSLGLGASAVGRIQFTPDLMPADITGTMMPDPASPGTLKFRPGPIFHPLLIADEINRATPKTQAAMLEAMAEKQVTVLGNQHQLCTARTVSDETVLPPFMVMATQNPIDQEGTYDLPEAQSDRFLFKVRLQMPDAAVIRDIVRKEVAPVRPGSSPPAATEAQQGEALLRLHRATVAVMSLELPDEVMAHVVNMVMASNGRFDQMEGMSDRRREALQRLVGDRISYPLGPRAASALAKTALAWSAVEFTGPDEAHGASAAAWRALAVVAVPALRHRLKILPDESTARIGTAEAEAEGLDRFVVELATAAAPDLSVGSAGPGYHQRFGALMPELRKQAPL